MNQLNKRLILAITIPLLISFLIIKNINLMTAPKRNLLPTNVVPKHYLITIIPDLNKFTFEGQSSITIDILDPTPVITFHCVEIKITSASLVVNKTETSSLSIDYNTKDQTCSLKFDNLQKSTDAILKLDYSGTINGQMNGFYRSSYKDENGVDKYMASTQFEATDARKAFPCWDEPSLKAHFTITLKIPSGLTAISNMDVESEQDEGQVKTIKFNKSLKMSTYLVAYAIGDFDYIEQYTKNNKVKCRVYGTRGSAKHGKFALGVATRTIDLFNDLFQIEYPMNKLDMLAVPDFDAGAMENWGLVTYRTVLVLYDEENSAAKTKQRIASVVAHELAHQWFGNLVTMEWWSELWLNEGFATWVGTYAVDKLFPEWNVWTQFFSEDMARGLQLDSLKSSHPIEVDVKEASEINEIFDAISYSKGASVIRMLSTYLTEDVFFEGIRQYLKKHKYSNASTKDLWSALSKVSNKDVNKFMELWTKKIGYPLLSVEIHGDDQVEIKQSRYLSSGKPTKDEDSVVWWVPLRYIAGDLNSISSKPKTENEILDSRSMKIKVSTKGYFKLNHDQTGVYRVLYPTQFIKHFGQLIGENQVLTSLDKIGIISDVTSLAVSGLTSITNALELFQHFKKETDYLVWAELSSSISKIISVWYEQPQDVLDMLNKVRLDMFSELAHSVGWEPHNNENTEKPLMTMLRSLAISNAGLAGDSKIMEEGRKRFDDFMDNNNQNAIHPDIRGAVFQIILNEGKEEDFNKVKELYLNTKIADQKMIALASLGTTSNKEAASKALDFSISDKVRNQDVIYIMSSLGSNIKTRRLAYNFIKAHWGLFESKYKTNLSILGSLIKYTAALLADKNDINDLNMFFKDKDTKPVNRALEQSIESIEANNEWLQRDKNNVEQWLKQRY